MAEEREVNIMPVELAIRRELAYREKLTGMYPEHDWKKEFLPLEVPSSTGISSQYPSSALVSEPCSSSVVSHPNSFQNTAYQNLSSTPSVLGEGPYSISDVSSHTSPLQNQDPSPRSWPNTTSGSFHSFPNQQSQQGTGPYPIPDLTMAASHHSIEGLGPSRVENRGLNSSLWSNLDMASNYSVNKATASSSHSFLYQHQRGLHIGDTNWFCRVCKLQCQTAYNYKQHVKGDKHKSKLQLQQTSRNVGALDKAPRPHCSLCDIWCSDVTSLESHFKGRKHQAKLMGIELDQKREAEAAPKQQLRCELCQILCTNEDTFRMHLDGKNHAARLHATRNNNRAI